MARNNQRRQNNRRIEPSSIAPNVMAVSDSTARSMSISNQNIEEDNNKRNNDRDNRKTKSSYVSKTKSKLGPNWHVRISDHEVKFKAAPKMVRDLSFFNVYPPEDGMYYKDHRLLQAMLSLAYSKVYYFTTLATAMQMFIDNLKAHGPYQPEIETIMLDIRNKLTGWTCVENGLQQLIINPDYVGVLTNLQIQLRDMRCNL